MSKPSSPRNSRRAALLGLLLALPAGFTGVLAAPAQNLPIHVNADKAEFTETAGESVYIGNVDLRRGDLRMTGSRLKVTRNPNTAELRAILVGSPATITQPDPQTGKTVTAQAKQIDYYSVEEVLIMKGDAKIMRGAEQMAGERIRYYPATKKIIADESRIEIVIDPSVQREPR